ncbi:MAG: bifunctional diaminohydroxyphosphoribosylaminopyrimidine deaminase/5-amino-6-(5-phosphoribosylamino)uracil reductase RibD [Saprospiraceae bacterium]|nr:bifunctional diaminohydroxyphosphoribosylaminopyrimidine deaminase/5-amino-6-(5-phosphoribosylamino)uracil reductase RibD [Saprospiraceae bacterium]
MASEVYMHRCLELARLGAGMVSPNPMVGAVLVWNNQIIGEGWHQQWGDAHAEVNCLKNVPPEHQNLISESTLYCNLEPCSHQGKTPPCADLIIKHKIPRVVVANIDPNPLVAGKGIQKMRSAGIDVKTGLLASEGTWLNRSFFTWIQSKRPYIILKWAQSADGFLGKSQERVVISGPLTQRLVHRWRSECDAILVGSNTAWVDNPRLDNRFYPGKKPTRIVLGTNRQIPDHFHLLDETQETWFIGKKEIAQGNRTKFLYQSEPVSLSWLMEELFRQNKAILLVEGGAQVLHQFLLQGFWDELRVIENPIRLQEGIPAPAVPESAKLKETWSIGADDIHIFARPSMQ